MAISKGIDLAALMAGWGIDVASGGGMAAIAGTVAGAALVNTFLLPAHFATAIYGTSLYKPINIHINLFATAVYGTSESFGERALHFYWNVLYNSSVISV